LELYQSVWPCDPSSLPHEIIERKGLGHPDTLADSLAEHLSVTYSKYCLSRFGAILRHQFDKLSLMCGRSEVRFGHGRLVEPIRVLVNGRAAPRLGAEHIPLRELYEAAIHEFWGGRFPDFNARTDLRLLFEQNHSTTGGIMGSVADNESAIHFRFNPRSLSDMPESTQPIANDTSIGYAFAPLSPLERFMLEVEGTLNSKEFRVDNPWIGSDIKMLAVRHESGVRLTAAVPQICGHVANFAEYELNLEKVQTLVVSLFADLCPQYELRLSLNTSDTHEGRKLYLTATGSSIESGDEGQVGRGNRMGGVISPARSFTMEGIAGKNPVYHVGKVYSAAAQDIAESISSRVGEACDVFLVSQMARPLADPWQALVRSCSGTHDPTWLRSVIEETMGDCSGITDRILRGEFRFF
jgi:S-adenosylmethionine synthetase